VKGLTAPGGNKKIRKLGRVWSFILAFLGLKDKLQASRVWSERITSFEKEFLWLWPIPIVVNEKIYPERENKIG
jgi:hypothetical protein